MSREYGPIGIFEIKFVKPSDVLPTDQVLSYEEANEWQEKFECQLKRFKENTMRSYDRTTCIKRQVK